MKTNNIIIIGAGPAGLSCALELDKNSKNKEITIFDKNDVVGGLARSYKYKRFYFDVGPHRFFTKNTEVLRLWKDILKSDFIEVPRLTRMYYKNKFFLYPIQIKDVIFKLGFIESYICLLSFIYSKIFLRNHKINSFEDWIILNFGKKLYVTFFKTYTEKVWGIPCSQISSKWALQRIRNLNFTELIKNALNLHKGNRPKTLIDKFYYPTQGAGMLYQKISEILRKSNHSILLNSRIVDIHCSNNRVTQIEYLKNNKRAKQKIDYLFSSMPLTDFILSLKPLPPQNVVEAARALYYRDHITVNLIVKGNPFPDNWIYIHSPEVLMARITNYNNFKPGKKSQKTSPIAVEYFCFKDDSIWNKNDSELIELAKDELEKIKLVDRNDVVEGFIIRETESYPTYYAGHEDSFNIIKNYVEKFTNVQLIGRGGMYKYNNMDHSIYTGMLAARNYNEGYKKYNVWNVNEDAEYLEEARGN